MTTTTAVIIIGHGTTDTCGVEQFFAMVRALQSRDAASTYYASFMELAAPSIEDAVTQAVRDGHRDVLCQPALLLTAGHAKNDLPAIIRAIAARHPGVKVRYGSPLNLSAELVSLCAHQVREATPGLDFSRCTLLVVGRGTSDPDANSNVSKLARMLEEGLGFRESAVCYFSTTHPRLPEGLERMARRAEGPIVAFPLILFSGVLNNQLDEELSRVRHLVPAAQFFRTPPFGNIAQFVEVFLLRVKSSIENTDILPCLLCKYRAPMPGKEHEVGQPLPSSHDHSHDHPHDDPGN